MTQKIRFLLNANQFVEDYDVIKERLTRHLQSLQRRSVAAGDNSEDTFDLDEPNLDSDWRAQEKIRRRASRWGKRHARLNGLGHLKLDVRRRLLEAPRLMRLEGVANEHAADEIAAQLFEESPWLGPAIEMIWRDMRRFAREGLGLKFRPILLDGPPGIGKTHLARRIGELTNVPALNFDVGTSSEGFRLTGLAKGWGTAQPSQIVERILDTGCANIVVFIDEIDKAGRLHSTGGAPTSVVTSLLALLEPRSASGWECPFYQLKFDLSHVNWILASNAVEHMSEPLRTRMQVVSLAGMSHGDLRKAAERECRLRGLSDAAVEDIDRLLNVLPEGHSALNMRTLSRALDDRQELERKPVLN